MQQHLIVLVALAIADFADSQCAPLTVEPPKKERPLITLTYNTDPDASNNYPNGTSVTFSCPEGYPITVDKYGVCINGKWMTLLDYGWQPTLPGWCQLMCDAEEVYEKGYDRRYKPNGGTQVHSQATVQFFCPTSLIKVGWHSWRCDDGYWRPVSSNYDKCTYW